MADDFVILFVGIYYLWAGVATLRHARRDGPTRLDSFLPLRGRWLRIVWGLLQLLLGLITLLMSILWAWWKIVRGI